MKKRTGDDWFPFWIDKWLLGSTRDELTIEQCAIWVDFLALSNKDDGYIRANEGIPYPIKRLSGLLNRPVKLIQQTIDRCLEPKVNKLRLESDGTLYMLSHDEYELSERHKRRLDDEAKPSLFKEKDIKKLILDDLDEKNLFYETEKICESGRIDIFIPGNPNQIIEIKSDNSADSIRAGMRQLLDYGIAFPGSILFIVFPGNISTRLKTKLKNHRIKIWKFPTKGHDDRQTDAKSREEKNREEERRIEKKVNINNKQENQITKELITVKGMGTKKINEIILYLRELSVEFPDIDYVEEMKKKVAWWRDNPLTKRSNIHLQIRNWFNIAQKYINEAKKQHQVGKNHGKHKTKYPMEFLSKIYALLRKQNKDGNKYAELMFALTDEEVEEVAEKYKDSPAEFIKFLEERK